MTLRRLWSDQPMQRAAASRMIEHAGTRPAIERKELRCAHWPAGRTGWTDGGVTFIEFSPEADIRPVLEHLAAQMATTG